MNDDIPNALTLYGDLLMTGPTVGLISHPAHLHPLSSYAAHWSCDSIMASEALERLLTDLLARIGNDPLNKDAAFRRKHLRIALKHLKQANVMPIG